MIEKLKMQTQNLVDKNVEQIGKIFPEVITETKDDTGNLIKGVDFDLLKQKLSNVLVEDENERYRLDWPGKRASLLKANTPIAKTLRPIIEESVDFEKTENLYIEGDNFEVLKILQESYLGKVKMIYIDPPYNTGNDFLYKDDFKKSEEEYDDDLGVYNELGEKLFKNTDSNGRFHSDWISMMYERLVIAKDMLKQDGAIFIQCDDNEMVNLKKICDEVFGEENFINTIIWKRKGGNTSPDKTRLEISHDYILLYQKSQLFNMNFIYTMHDSEDYISSMFKYEDEFGKYRLSPLNAPKYRPTLVFDFMGYKPHPNGWSMTKEKLTELYKANRIVFPKEKEGRVNRKQYLNEWKGYSINSVWTDISVIGASSGERTLIGTGQKPLSLLSRIIQMSCGNNDIILDYFSGSATTAIAVLQHNAECSKNIKYIMVQLQENTDEESEAFKSGYKTIPDIARDRIKSVGAKIKEEYFDKYNKKFEKLKNELQQETLMGNEEIVKQKEELDLKIQHINNLDIGFRVYRTDSSNMKDIYYHPTSLTQLQLSAFESNIKEDRTPEDLLTQVILDLGLELSLPIEKKEILGNNVFIVQENALVACFDDSIDFGIVDKIADIKPLKVVFKDASFKDDKDRVNVEERFKRLSPETIVSVI